MRIEPKRLSQFTLEELCAVVLEVNEVDNGADACGVPCPWGHGHSYCGRRKGHAASDDPDTHFTKVDAFDYAAPKLANALLDKP